MKRKAFTLVELLVVIAIIGLLTSIAMVSLSSSRDKARIAAGQSLEQSIHNAAADEILAQWDFDECTGINIVATSATDASGNGNDGIPANNPLWSADTPAKKGCSMLLNGSNQSVSGAQSITQIASQSFTISAWARRTTLGPAANIIFSIGDSYTNSSLLHFGFRSANTFFCAFYGNDYTTAATYTDTDWHLWTCSYDATTRKRNLYRDGVLIGGDTANPFIGSGVPRIGRRADGLYFAGPIDNVRLYRKSLTAQAVEKLYAEGVASHRNGIAAR